jgi:hypothetical protein
VLLEYVKGRFKANVHGHKVWCVELWPIQTVSNDIDRQRVNGGPTKYSRKYFNGYVDICQQEGPPQTSKVRRIFRSFGALMVTEWASQNTTDCDGPISESRCKYSSNLSVN